MQKLIAIKQKIADLSAKQQVQLLVVTKNQPIERIRPLLEAGHLLFGENRVQEASSKWPKLKIQYPHICLHLIGHLQTNKVREAVNSFNVIETLDSTKLAEKLVLAEQSQNKKLTYYIEVNIGNELQKNGILPRDCSSFLQKLRTDFPSLHVKGIMCIPPAQEDPTKYFKHTALLANELKLPIKSMGMSADFDIAIQQGSNLVRIGRALFE